MIDNGANGIPFGYVAAVATLDNAIYAAGGFVQAGPVAANFVARWNGATWESLDPDGISALDGPATAIATVGDGVVVAGRFLNAAGNRSASLAVFAPPDPIIFTNGFE